VTASGERPATETVRWLAAARQHRLQYESPGLDNACCGWTDKEVACTLEAAAQCDHTILLAARPGYDSSWCFAPPADCPRCKGSGVDPARLAAAFKELEK